MSYLLPDWPHFNGQPETSTANGEQLCILVIGAGHDARLLLRTLLRLWKYKAREIDNPAGAAAAIDEFRPALIVIDSFFPFEVNLQLIEQIRKTGTGAKVPIIQLSGFSQPEFRETALASGASDFLVKPIDFESLRTCIRQNIEKYTAAKRSKGEN